MQDTVGCERIHSAPGERTSTTAASTAAAKSAWWASATRIRTATAAPSFFCHDRNSLPLQIMKCSYRLKRYVVEIVEVFIFLLFARLWLLITFVIPLATALAPASLGKAATSVIAGT
jgi:hypothetical protein